MITSETAASLWNCHREIVTGQKLLDDMAKAANEFDHDKHAPSLKDAFGRRRNLQLGIPSGNDSHRLFDVAPDLAVSIIKAHIANKQSELVRLNEAARLELGSDNPE